MIYLHYKDTKTFGHSFSFLLIFKTLRASYLQVGNFSNFIDKIKEYAQKANCRLLVLSEGYLPQLRSLSKKDTDILYLPTAGEEEFLGAMKNAKAVFTPSFHGNVFSILNHQNLFSLVLEDGHDTRANELLTQIGMGDRLFKITDQFIDRPVDYDAVDAEIQKLRTKALDFVKHSLS